jgi:hypothetical protein
VTNEKELPSSARGGARGPDSKQAPRQGSDEASQQGASERRITQRGGSHRPNSKGAGEPPGSGPSLVPRAWFDDERLTDLDRAIGQLLLKPRGAHGQFPSMARLARELAQAGRPVTPRWVRARIRHMEQLGYLERRPVFKRPDDPLWSKRGRPIDRPGEQVQNDYLVHPSPRPAPASSGGPPEVSTGPADPPEVAVTAGQPPGSGHGLTVESVPPTEKHQRFSEGTTVATGSPQSKPYGFAATSPTTAPPARPDAGEEVAARNPASRSSGGNGREQAKNGKQGEQPCCWRAALGQACDGQHQQEQREPVAVARPPPSSLHGWKTDDGEVARVLVMLDMAGLLVGAEVIACAS